jgi:adenylate kinase family enzyme
MKRVMIVGPCGAGKSTLGFMLAERLGLPLFHMDRLAWKPGWIDSTTDELRGRLAPIVGGERWLIEGNYGSTLADRLPRADTVVYLQYPVLLCLWRIVRRYWRYRGQTRPEMTEGCPEQLHLPFLWYAARWNSRPRRNLETALAGHEHKVIRFRRPRDLEQWVASMGADALANTGTVG